MKNDATSKTKGGRKWIKYNFYQFCAVEIFPFLNDNNMYVCMYVFMNVYMNVCMYVYINIYGYNYMVITSLWTASISS